MKKRAEFAEVLEHFKALDCFPKDEMEFRETRNFFQIWDSRWPLKETKQKEGAIHYEFLDMETYITIELHLEKREVSGLRGKLDFWRRYPVVNSLLSDNGKLFAEEWFKKYDCYRFGATFSDTSVSAETIAMNMRAFIQETRPQITEWLHEESLLK